MPASPFYERSTAVTAGGHKFCFSRVPVDRRQAHAFPEHAAAYLCMTKVKAQRPKRTGEPLDDAATVVLRRVMAAEEVHTWPGT